MTRFLQWLQEKDEMDAFLDDIKDVEDKASPNSSAPQSELWRSRVVLAVREVVRHFSAI